MESGLRLSSVGCFTSRSIWVLETSDTSELNEAMWDAMDKLGRDERDEYEEEDGDDKFTETQESCRVRDLVVGEDICLAKQVRG